MRKSIKELNNIADTLQIRLIGYYSVEFESPVEYVFLTPNHEEHAKKVLSAIKAGVGYPPHPSDIYTIAVGLENGNIVGITQFVQEDSLEDLIPLVEDLDYMDLSTS